MADPIQGYFNSTTFTLDVNGFPIWNRAVGSEFMAKFAHTVLGNGAAAVTTGGFQVVKKTGMTVTVKPYFICKNGYMMYQTGETDIEFTSSTSEQVFYIGARLDVANNHFDGDDVGAFTTFVSATDIAACKLTITANAVTITDGMIEDLRYNTTYCGQLDEFRERSLALLAELEQELEDVLAGGVPAHASTHEVDGTDPVTERYEATFEATGWTATDDIAVETDVSGGSVEIVGATFKSAVSDTVGTYTFTYVLSETSWQLDSTNVSLSTYGITLTGSPSDGDTITAEYAVKYVQSDSVSGITSGMVLKADLSLDDSLTMTTRLAQISAFSNVSRIDSGTDKVILTCLENKPKEDFTILVEVAL